MQAFERRWHSGQYEALVEGAGLTHLTVVPVSVARALLVGGVTVVALRGRVVRMLSGGGGGMLFGYVMLDGRAGGSRRGDGVYAVHSDHSGKSQQPKTQSPKT